MIILLQDSQPTVPGMPAGAQEAPATGTATTADPAQGGAAQQAPAGGGFMLFLPLIAIMVLMIFLSGGAQRKEKKRKAELLASIKKHDRVQMIGGLIATISEVRDDEVVLIIDEQNKTKARYSKAAVQQVLREAPGVSEPAGVEPELAAQTTA